VNALPSQENDEELMFQFIGGNFHQDWPYDFDSESAVVLDYRKNVGPAEAHALEAAIDRVLQRGLTEEALIRMLEDYGMATEPIGSDGTATGWLRETANELRECPRES